MSRKTNFLKLIFWSGKRDSNSRPQPWQGCISAPWAYYYRLKLNRAIKHSPPRNAGVFISTAPTLPYPEEALDDLVEERREKNQSDLSLHWVATRSSRYEYLRYEGTANGQRAYCLERRARTVLNHRPESLSSTSPLPVNPQY